MTEQQTQQRRYALAVSGGICEACGKPLRDGQAQGAHRIGNTKQNRAKYGDFVIDHRFNIGYTCSLSCNGKLDISGDTGAATRLCARIYEAEVRKYKGKNEN